MLYVARRFLNISPAEWDALPWWQSRMYVDGLKREGLLTDGKPLPGRDGGTPASTVYADMSRSKRGSFRKAGLRERTVSIPRRGKPA